MNRAVAFSPPPPSVPLLARPLLHRLATHWAHGSLIVDLPGGASPIVIGDARSGPVVRWSLANWRAVRRLMVAGDLGFAEGYLDGDWDTPDLAALLTGFAVSYDTLATPHRRDLLAMAQGLRHALRRNTRQGSRRNIVAHYDLGNEFYACWLDPSMTYSSGLFADPDEPLETAQRRKYRALARAAGIRPGDKVLEIGCGWGGFAHYAAAELGAEVTAITLSPAQKTYAETKIQREGLADRVTIRLQDYRDVRGQFDAVVSIEMIEAVGEAYWPRYFGLVADRLKPGGRAALQAITLREDLFADYRRRPDFIQLQVFPGGMLPTDDRLLQLARDAGLTPDAAGLSRFGLSYALTLRRWRARFEAAAADGQTGRSEARFQRLWSYYLAYCEAGFVSGRTDVVHLGLTKGAG